MQVKGKLFPYPVINHDKNLSNYKDLDFAINYEILENDVAYILKNCHLETNSNLINLLLEEGKIGISLIIECSDTVYRKSFTLTKEKRDIELVKTDFMGKVDISMFAFAKTDFCMNSKEFEEDYQNINFEIEKYDIIGANDGFYVRFKHEEFEDTLVQSIFSIISSRDLEEGAYLVECSIGRKIAITLSEEDYNNYKIIYTVPAYKEVFFNMILIPSLIEGLSLCKCVIEDESKDFEDIETQYPWFHSIERSYKKLKGVELSMADLRNLSPVLLAQELLGKPLGSALKNLVLETNRIDEGE